MEDKNFFKELFESMRDYRKIVFLMNSIKNDVDILKECGLSNDFIQKVYNEGKQIKHEEKDKH